jgi:hypothetical protein
MRTKNIVIKNLGTLKKSLNFSEAKNNLKKLACSNKPIFNKIKFGDHFLKFEGNPMKEIKP